MSLIEKIRGLIVSKNPKQLFVFSVVSVLCFIFIVNLVLEPSPPEMPEFFHGKDKSEILRGLNWHLKNNPGQILGDSKSCILALETSPVAKCDYLNLKQNLSGSSSVSGIMENKKKFVSLFWNSESHYSNKKSALAFNPFEYSVKEIISVSDTQGIFGNEMQILFTINSSRTSENIKLLEQLFTNDKNLAEFEKKLQEKLPVEHEIKLTLYNNRYGYFLPIKSLN